ISVPVDKTISWILGWIKDPIQEVDQSFGEADAPPEPDGTVRDDTKPSGPDREVQSAAFALAQALYRPIRQTFGEERKLVIKVPRMRASLTVEDLGGTGEPLEHRELSQGERSVWRSCGNRWELTPPGQDLEEIPAEATVSVTGRTIGGERIEARV